MGDVTRKYVDIIAGGSRRAARLEDLHIEALADRLARKKVYDWITGDTWYGFPDDDDDDEMLEACELMLPGARKEAERYARILVTGKDDE